MKETFLLLFEKRVKKNPIFHRGFLKMPFLLRIHCLCVDFCTNRVMVVTADIGREAGVSLEKSTENLRINTIHCSTVSPSNLISNEIFYIEPCEVGLETGPGADYPLDTEICS
ncbi:unnamed protein product [Pleuronectes platessa]|uniref:Uncharacterized protein n=1 Tax=Pleuronectes platessa TaxID=8262 RepID=A0A9N7VJQ4_PLEPL|nr:unnamed protein product [Pleuronectes platessa]